MEMDVCWLPELEYCDNLSQWAEYEEMIYDIFIDDFITDVPQFRDKDIKIREYPRIDGKEESFYHVTCKDYFKTMERNPDLRRCERIRWVRAFIENYNCDPTLCEDCEGVKVWCETYKGKKRIHFLLVEEKYMVVIEKRPNYYQLITAFYFDYDNALEKKLKHYDMYKNDPF